MTINLNRQIGASPDKDIIPSQAFMIPHHDRVMALITNLNYRVSTPALLDKVNIITFTAIKGVIPKAAL